MSSRYQLTTAAGSGGIQMISEDSLRLAKLFVDDTNVPRLDLINYDASNNITFQENLTAGSIDVIKFTGFGAKYLSYSDGTQTIGDTSGATNNLFANTTAGIYQLEETGVAFPVNSSYSLDPANNRAKIVCNKNILIDPNNTLFVDGILDMSGNSIQKVSNITNTSDITITPTSTLTVAGTLTLPNGSNTITVDSSVPHITVSDGTTTNTINKFGYTTRNTTADSTHYLNFSDSSGTGTGSIQKTAGLSCNPSTNTITATTFSGALTGTATNATNTNTTAVSTNATHYMQFKSATTGFLPDLVDTDLTYNPSTNTLTASNISGNLTGNVTGDLTGTASNATNTETTAVSTNATHYLEFKSATTGSLPNLVDTDLTYNPSTNTLTATNIVGNLTGNVTGDLTGTASNATNSTNSLYVNVTKVDDSSTYYPVFTGIAGSGSRQIYSDDAPTALTYVPSTGLLTVPSINVSGGATGSLDFVTDTTCSIDGAKFNIGYQAQTVNGAVAGGQTARKRAIALSNAVTSVTISNTGVAGGFIKIFKNYAATPTTDVSITIASGLTLVANGVTYTNTTVSGLFGPYVRAIEIQFGVATQCTLINSYYDGYQYGLQAISTATTIAATSCYGNIINATSLGTYTLPTAVAGMNITFVNPNASSVTIACQTGASINGTLNGTFSVAANSLATVAATSTTTWFIK